MANKKIHILGGGTFSQVRSHLALSAPAFGETARRLAELCSQEMPTLDINLHLTAMAGGDRNLVINDDVQSLVDTLVLDPATKIIIMTVAFCDYNGDIDGVPGTKLSPRLHSRTDTSKQINIFPAPKVLNLIRKSRKDIFLVAFKTTVGATEDQQYVEALHLLKESSCNLVLANDIDLRRNMIVTPEEARYCVTSDRSLALKELVAMIKTRSHLTFTRSTVVAGEPIPWDSDEVYPSLRAVVNHCIQEGAYKPFRGATVGHFACKIGDNVFLTSIRKSNFNDLAKTGLVKVVTDGPDNVLAYGAKPSVGGQSQRIVFEDHPDYDCIVHFHCPKKPESEVPTVSQKEYECGSHECGRNTSNGLKRFGNLSAVYLAEHGPNIVFNHSIDPKEVIEFIETNFDLARKTGGYVTLGQILSTPDHLDDLRSFGKQ